MAYCAQADLQARIGLNQLAELSNDTANSGAVDATVVTAMIERADRTIDRYAGQVYTVPFVAGTNCTTIPSQIQQLSIDLSIYYLFMRRPGFLDCPRDWKDAYNDAMKVLADVSNLLTFLDGSPTVLSSEADIVAPDKIADFENDDSQWEMFRPDSA